MKYLVHILSLLLSVTTGGFSTRQVPAERFASVRKAVVRHSDVIIYGGTAEKEPMILKGYYAEQANLFKQKKLNAAKTLDVGEYPTAKISDRNSWAALMQVVSTIYNMEEAITKT